MMRKAIFAVVSLSAFLNHDGIVWAGLCDFENTLMVQCLQNNILRCGVECVSTVTTSIEIANPLHVDGDCSVVVNEWCGISQCCPQCFGEIQQSLDCHFYGSDIGHSDHEPNILVSSGTTTKTEEALDNTNSSTATSMTHSSCDTKCPCTDVPNWHDDGGEAFGCAWYAEKPEERCEAFGNRNMNNGHVGNTACCVCEKLIHSAAAPTTTRPCLFSLHPLECWKNVPSMILMMTTIVMIVS